MIQISYDGKPSLYLVPTPIGNFDDITVRSLDVLKSSDYIFCEDTRETIKLLKHFNITKKLVSCHEYNENEVKLKVVNFLRDGYNIALVTDQGTPIISDPGYLVSKFVIENGFNVVSLPGATAFVPALTVSGLSPSSFLFYGFLNSKESKMRSELEMLKFVPHTIIFYESNHRIVNTLKLMLEVFGDRNVCLCRELSKIHEEVYRNTLSEIVNDLDVLKGEFVVVVEGNLGVNEFESLSLIDHVKLYIEEGLSSKEAIKLVAKERNLSKSIVYNEYHKGDVE